MGMQISGFIYRVVFVSRLISSEYLTNGDSIIYSKARRSVLTGYLLHTCTTAVLEVVIWSHDCQNTPSQEIRKLV